MCSADIFLGVLAILFPPLPVWVKCGICSADSIINILLCCLGFLPGLIHAWYIIVKFPEPAYEYESLPQEGGRVTYVYVHEQNCRPPPRQGGMSYGTTQGGGQHGGAAAPESSGQGASNAHEGTVPPSYAEVVAGDHKTQTP
ncbi:uncharacterized protein UV8b_00990 [Ustilaginoidea virens]|uniref:Uncharacterized protein n=1 Tax=Ustilaginoidea virens TaxID=1159556 RepID=A0A063BSW1_USTVR|nr:uncharacterized protein UV8b_00990 [Ustilaginoidea virens]QUC16749.1 hypothetical protein UV8b_00990 [Ustilaginoidea virens]GAO17966.1 hypothetical protein UVI_02056250 [Ustilaginoidea virens]